MSTNKDFFTVDRILAIMQQNIEHVKNSHFWANLSKKDMPDIGYATVNGRSPRRHAQIVQHLQQDGFRVHAPSSWELFQKACENFNENAMCCLPECPPELLKHVIMVEIKTDTN
jgi:hypothetical protein